MRLYVGFDPREAIGFHTFLGRLIALGGREVEIIPLCGEQQDGTNAFTYERFRIPDLMNWSGTAIFVDACDMLLRAPIHELMKLRDPSKAVQVVKHDYRTRHPRKYVGTELEAGNGDYPRKNWSSVILWNCGHRAHFNAREEMRGFDGAYLHRFSWLKDEEIGELPIEWNWLADEYGENDKAKLLHWTAGIPGFYHYRNAPHADEWKAAARKVTAGMA